MNTTEWGPAGEGGKLSEGNDQCSEEKDLHQPENLQATGVFRFATLSPKVWWMGFFTWGKVECKWHLWEFFLKVILSSVVSRDSLLLL